MKAVSVNRRSSYGVPISAIALARSCASSALEARPSSLASRTIQSWHLLIRERRAGELPRNQHFNWIPLDSGRLSIV